MILNFLWLRICGYIGDNATLWKNGQPKKKYKLAKNKRSLQNPAIEGRKSLLVLVINYLLIRPLRGMFAIFTVDLR